jgi:uncharacterized secreted protein with C-terminal beta-propeller domain
VTPRTLVVPLAALALLAGCSAPAHPADTRWSAHPPRPEPVTLTAAKSCDELMTGLRSALRPLVGSLTAPVPGSGPAVGGARDNAAAPGAVQGDAGIGDVTPDHSETTVAEAGVDEPDLVKTDGRRIVTVSRGVLWVVDAATRELTGTLALGSSAQPTNLLLYRDKALVLLPTGTAGGIAGAHLLLVDLSTGTPTVASGFVIDGQLVDARQVGSVVRVVTHSAPRIPGILDGVANGVDQAGPDQWLPRYAVSEPGRTTTGRVDCARVRRPAVYSGSSLLTLLTFDLNQPALSDGSPLTVVADGGTVYATPTSLYVLAAARATTDVFRFDTTGADAPRFVASGSVPGYVLNEYAVSEWQGDLRVATTINQSTSSVYVLRPTGDVLSPVGHVDGLGHGQKIYAVRYLGPVGYVVTFRQTDPLYTLDLSDPSRPVVTGALEIDGYSAYLHPVAPGRLLGVGQTSDPATGRNHGLAVSLFDVSDPAQPTRLSRFELLGAGHSIAEFNPHAFLYWPASRLAVVPIRTGAVALRVSDAAVARAGSLQPQSGQLVRALVVGTTLWTVSTDGLTAADLTSLATEAWIAF